MNFAYMILLSIALMAVLYPVCRDADAVKGV